MNQEELLKLQEFCERQAAQAEPKPTKVCSICDGRGYMPTDKDGYRFVVRCQCRKEKELADRIAQTGIPQKFWHCSLDSKPKDPSAKFIVGKKKNPSGSDALAAASRERALKVCVHLKDLYLEHFLSDDDEKKRKDDLFGLLLFGNCGLGKTRLAASLLLDLVRGGLRHVRFIEYNELFKRIRFSYSKDGPSYQGIFKDLINTSVLVIDDFGMEVSGDHVWVLDNIGYIINERYVKNRPTILTTNFWKPLSTEASARANEHLSKFSELPSWQQRKAHEEDQANRKQVAAIRRQEEAWEKVSYRLRSRISEMCLQVKLEGHDFRRRLGEKREFDINKVLNKP